MLRNVSSEHRRYLVSNCNNLKVISRHGVGYDNVLNIGDEVNSSTPLLSLYSSKNIDDNLINKIKACFIISDKKTQKLSEIFETIN